MLRTDSVLSKLAPVVGSANDCPVRRNGLIEQVRSPLPCRSFTLTEEAQTAKHTKYEAPAGAEASRP